jgi:hypothetical protein
MARSGGRSNAGTVPCNPLYLFHRPQGGQQDNPTHNTEKICKKHLQYPLDVCGPKKEKDIQTYS